MRARLRRLTLVAAALAAYGFGAAAVPAGTAEPLQPRDRLPDLDQALPTGLFSFSEWRGGARTFHIAFDSAVDNVGAGPLVIIGRRPSTEVADMRAEQRVARTDGSTRTYAQVGVLRYVHSHDHAHWHLLRFDRYELRRESDYALARPDRKTGFCLGDRYETDPTRQLAGEPAVPRYTGYCGKGQPQRLSVTQGISVGYGDDYPGRLEGQSIDVTRLPGGRYHLVHRANADGRLREGRYTNNAASVLVRLRWPSGFQSSPTLTVLGRCPNRDRCWSGAGM